MSHVYIASDLHLGHANICNFRTQFSSVEEHDGTILENYNSLIRKQDTVIFLGDVAFTKERLADVGKLAGNKILVCGNHDLERGIGMQDLVNTYSKVYAFHKKKGFWLSHCPIHPEELRGKFNIHGHVHDKTLEDPRYFNASMENINYTPINFKEIKEIMKDRNYRGDKFYEEC